MALTDIEIKGCSASLQDVWLSDEKGLRLLIKTNGSKYWRLKYRFLKKQKTLALGVYPEVSLKKARELVAEAKKAIAMGIDPSEQRKEDSRQVLADQENCFESIALDWWNHQKGTWTTVHADRVWGRLKGNSFAAIGKKPITNIHPQDVIAIIRKIERREAYDIAHRVLQDIRRVCRFAVQLGKLQNSPVSELTGILKTRKTVHRPSLPREELPAFLKVLPSYDDKGRIITRLALELLVLTFVRSGELRGAKWSEFDFDACLWRIPAERMKMDSDHVVPLSKQSLDILEQLKPISGQYHLLFPSERDRLKPMSDNTMRRAIFKLGYDGEHEGKSKAVPHGFRATACSILNESGFNPDAIERQMSHMERNGVRAAYTHHARYLDERTKMMQWWADYLDEMRNTGKVIPIFANQG